MSDEASYHHAVVAPTPTAGAALAAREDLHAYAPNARGLFALELRFGIDDVQTVADDSLTDDTRDHKCDLLYVDRDSGTAVIAQLYSADDPTKAEAPANKAADLNTALTWILSATGDSALGDKLRSAAADFRDALDRGEVSVVEVWFVHNLPESDNVAGELRQVEETAAALLQRHFPDVAQTVEVRAIEVGRDRLEIWYQSTSGAILVSGSFPVPTRTGFFEVSGDGWDAICTSVPAKWLKLMYGAYEDQLFSANVRGPIASRRSQRNINYMMEKTAKDLPERFWAYNNGITALVSCARS